MAISFQCPACDADNMADDDLAGMRIPCRECSSHITVPEQRILSSEQVAEGPPLHRTDAQAAGGPSQVSSGLEDLGVKEGRPLPRPPRRSEPEDEAVFYGAPGWNTVRTGLGLIFWGLISLLLTLLPGIVAVALIVMRPFLHPGTLWTPTVLTVVGTLLIEVLVILAGHCMCSAAPRESQLKGLALGAAGLTVLLFLATVFLMFVLETRNAAFVEEPDFAGRAEMKLPALLLMLACGIMGVLSHALFVLFIRGVARSFHNETLAEGANSYLVSFLIIVGLIVFLCLGSDPELLMIFGLLGFAALGMILIMRLLFLLKEARDCISRAIG